MNLLRTYFSLLAEPFEFAYMRWALVITLSAAVVCALLSCWVVLMGWSLLGDAIAHAVLPGVVIAFFLGLPYAIGALVFALLAVWLIGVVRETTVTREDAAIGVVFTGLLALGVVLISKYPTESGITHIFVGSPLGISPTNRMLLLAFAAATVVILLVRHRDLTLLAFDRTHMHSVGLDPRRLTMLLLFLLALTIVVSLQAIGMVLVVALLVTPGATARLLTDRFTLMLAISPALAVASTFAGWYASWYWHTSVGGMVVLTQTLLFAVAYGWSAWRRRVRITGSPSTGTPLRDAAVPVDPR